MSFLLVAMGFALCVVAILHCLGTVTHCLVAACTQPQVRNIPPAGFSPAHKGSTPCPTITYLMEARPGDAVLRLERGEILTVPWPHTLHVLLPNGVQLQVLDATPEQIRVKAV